MRSFYGLPRNFALFNNVPRNILAEGINGPAQVTAQADHQTDTGGVFHGPMGHNPYVSTPQMRRERVGEAPKVTALAPRGTRHRSTSNFGKNLPPLVVEKVRMLQTAFAVDALMKKLLKLPANQRAAQLATLLDQVSPKLTAMVGLRSAQLMRQGHSAEKALRTALTATLTVADAKRLATFNNASSTTAQAGALGAVGDKRTVASALAARGAVGKVSFEAPPAPTGPLWVPTPAIDVEGLLFPIDPKLKNYVGGNGQWFIPSPTPYAPEQMLALAVAASKATKALRDQGDKYLGPDVTIGEWPLLAKIFPPSAHHIRFALRMLEPWKYRPLAKFKAPQFDNEELGMYLWVTFKGKKNTDYWWSDTNQIGQHNGQFSKMAGITPSDWKLEDVEQVFATIQPFKTTIRTTWYNDVKSYVADNAGALACAAAGVTAAAVGGTTGGVIAGAAGALCTPNPGGNPGAAAIPDRPLPKPPISTTTWLLLGVAAAGLGYTLLQMKR